MVERVKGYHKERETGEGRGWLNLKYVALDKKGWKITISNWVKGPVCHVFSFFDQTNFSSFLYRTMIN